VAAVDDVDFGFGDVAAMGFGLGGVERTASKPAKSIRDAIEVRCAAEG